MRNRPSRGGRARSPCRPGEGRAPYRVIRTFPQTHAAWLSFHPKSITDLRSGVVKQRSSEKSKNQLSRDFRVVRFSTFGTISALSRLGANQRLSALPEAAVHLRSPSGPSRPPPPAESGAASRRGLADQSSHALWTLASPLNARVSQAIPIGSRLWQPDALDQESLASRGS